MIETIQVLYQQIRIDLTRMECKYNSRNHTRVINPRIDLTRMECKY